MSMTYKEVTWRMRAITDRQNSDIKLNAILHDKKMKASNSKVSSNLSDEQQEKIDEAIKARMKNGRHQI